MMYVRHHKFRVGDTPWHLTIVKAAESDRKGNRYWWCRCECRWRTKNPPLIRVREDNLRSGRTTSCGCAKAQRVWERNKKNSKPNVGEPATPLSTEVPAIQEDTGSKSQPQIDPIKVEGHIPGQCPHGMPADESPIEGRVTGISSHCYRCMDLWTPRDLTREWERVLNLAHKLDLGRRLEVSTDGNTGDNLITVGGSAEIELVAEESNFMEFEWDEEGNTQRRKPARRKASPGAGPDVDRSEED
jgi:hypothetical protein